MTSDRAGIPITIVPSSGSESSDGRNESDEESGDSYNSAGEDIRALKKARTKAKSKSRRKKKKSGKGNEDKKASVKPIWRPLTNAEVNVRLCTLSSRASLIGDRSQDSESHTEDSEGNDFRPLHTAQQKGKGRVSSASDTSKASINIKPAAAAAARKPDVKYPLSTSPPSAVTKDDETDTDDMSDGRYRRHLEAKAKVKIEAEAKVKAEAEAKARIPADYDADDDDEDIIELRAPEVRSLVTMTSHNHDAHLLSVRPQVMYPRVQKEARPHFNILKAEQDSIGPLLLAKPLISFNLQPGGSNRLGTAAEAHDEAARARKPTQVPQGINRYLRDYQREGIKFFYEHYAKKEGGILGE